MPQKLLSTQDLIEAVAAVARFKERGYETGLSPNESKGNKPISAVVAAANDIGMNADTLNSRLKVARDRLGLTPDNINALPVPQVDDDRPHPLDLLDRHRKLNAEYIQKKRTKPHVFLVKPEPMCIGLIGDPHLSNAGANLDALKADMELLARTGTRAIGMGDILDNFHANTKLAAKEAQNRVSIQEGLSLAKWFIAESGVKWDAHVLGNHDLWIGVEGVALLAEWVRQARSRLYDWNARLIYKWGDAPHERITVAASHDFKGSSIYNPLHGNAKMALFDGTADVYIAAHRHNHADSKLPNGYRGKTYQLIRVRGYKDYDSYSAGRAQFPDHDGMEGRSAALVINPLSQTHDGRQRVFMDLSEGIEYANMLKDRR